MPCRGVLARPEPVATTSFGAARYALITYFGRGADRQIWGASLGRDEVAPE